MQIPPELKEISKRDLIRLNSSKDELILKLQNKIEELERRLMKYENSNVPPSQNNRKYPKREKSNNPVGAPKGHEGITRPLAKPNRFIKLEQKKCPDCNKQLGRPVSIQTRIIEDIPDPQPLKITQFEIPHYHCNYCNKEIIPEHPDLPEQGRFGPNLLAEVTLLKYEDRLPDRKITNVLNRRHSLDITHATVINILSNVAAEIQPIYGAIKEEIKKSQQVNADETGNKINGKNVWSWVFVTPSSVLHLISDTRGQKTIKEALGENYKGKLGCDGWTSYPKCVKIL